MCGGSRKRAPSDRELRLSGKIDEKKVTGTIECKTIKEKKKCKDA